MNFPIRVNKYVRDMGLATRREADVLVSEDKILVNGKKAKSGMYIQEKDVVTLVPVDKHYIYLAYYKPRGLPTQAPAGVTSAITKWKEKGLFPVGRLDKDSEGLLIITNDGRITETLLGDKTRFEKEYIVSVREPLREGLVAIFARGMETKTFGQLLPAKARLITKNTMQIILREGKRHQVRVMLAELGYTVTELRRVRIGCINTNGLYPGQMRPLLPSEIDDIMGYGK